MASPRTTRYQQAEQARSSSQDIATRLYQHRREAAGDDDPVTLRAAHALGWALWNLGRYAEARDVDQDTLDRRRRTLGPDHPHTLTSTRNLARDVAMLEADGGS